jgi:hypothetical protein
VRRWVSTTSIAILLCALGAATLFLPWADLTVVQFDPSKPRRADGVIEGRIYFESNPGYRFWHAGAAAGGFLSLLLFLVATGGFDPVPPWRSAAQLAVGGAIAGAVDAGMNYPYAVAEADMAAGRLAELSWGAVNVVVIGLAAAVMLAAAIELRGHFGGRRRERASAELGAAADRGRDSGAPE